MTAINYLIKKIKEDNPPIAYISRKDIRRFAEHMRMKKLDHSGSIETYVKAIEAGDVKFMGIPLRVSQ